MPRYWRHSGGPGLSLVRSGWARLLPSARPGGGESVSLYASAVANHRPSAPAGFWLVTAGIFAINAVVAAGNGIGLMAFLALVATVAALWAAWVASPNSRRAQRS